MRMVIKETQIHPSLYEDYQTFQNISVFYYYLYYLQIWANFIFFYFQ